MSKPNAIFAVARIRALEKKLISKEKMDRLAESGKDEVMRFLSESGYGQDSDSQSLDDGEAIIENELLKTYDEIDSLLEGAGEFISLFRLKYDIQNLKLLLKLRLTQSGEKPTFAQGGIYDTNKLADAVKNAKYDFLPEIIENALTFLELSFFTDKDPQLISVTLDGAYIEYALEKGNDFAKTYFRAMADYDNIITFIRLKNISGDKKMLEKLLLPQGDIKHEKFFKFFDDDLLEAVKKLSPTKSAYQQFEQNPSAQIYEKARDNYLLSLVKEHKEELDTMMPILGFMLAKEQEAKCVRLIVTAKRNDLPADVIRERLRELYV